MARLVLMGEAAQVELTRGDEDGQVIAMCVEHDALDDSCDWTETYDDLSDAAEYAESHADRGTR